jgi:hypothetical protein
VAEKNLKSFGGDMEFIKGGLVSMELRQIGPQFSPISEVILTLVPGTLNEIDRDLNQVVITLVAPNFIGKTSLKKRLILINWFQWTFKVRILMRF